MHLRQRVDEHLSNFRSTRFVYDGAKLEPQLMHGTMRESEIVNMVEYFDTHPDLSIKRLIVFPHN